MQLIFSRSQVFTLCKVLDAIEEREEFDNVAGITIEPLEVQAEADEDSGDEELDPGLANKPTGFRLRAQAHLLQKKITIVIPTVQMLKLKLKRLKRGRNHQLKKRERIG